MPTITSMQDKARPLVTTHAQTIAGNVGPETDVETRSQTQLDAQDAVESSVKFYSRKEAFERGGGVVWGTRKAGCRHVRVGIR
ncbi:unnamed protein product [Arctia plantaginis]|uniref:Uncharacterized protein n=1 Tax=Arctia plantaginis TaxID=874455 RepID=A0A8S1AEU0_ARCPL|nr:unnamed protein product [Arctia plantaginis]